MLLKIELHESFYKKFKEYLLGKPLSIAASIKKLSRLNFKFNFIQNRNFFAI